jgi:hypothetical protein
MKRLIFVSGISMAAGLLAVTTASGCSAIVSAGDYHLEDLDASGGDGGAGAETSLPDTSSPPLPDGGDAEVAPGDAGGKCGDGLPKNDPAFKALLNGCLLQAGCDWAEYNLSVSECVTLNALKAFQAEAPLLTATKCSDVERLTGRGYTTTECNGLPDGYQCSGTKSVYCKQGGSYGFEDCAIVGGTCAKYTVSGGDAGAQTYSSCMVAPTCAGGDGTAGCSGNNAYTCEQGHGFGAACAPGTTMCNPSTGDCNFVGDACPSKGDSCDKSGRIVSCLASAGVPNMAYTFDCTTAGLACTPESSTAASCVAPNCTLDDAKNCKEHCKDATTATFCIGGAPLDVSCTAAGFSACEMRGTSSDRAQCR